MTGIALDGQRRARLAAGARAPTGYTVYRGTTADLRSRRAHTGRRRGGRPSFTDTGRANGTTYYYAVRAIAGGIESATRLPSRHARRACVLDRQRRGARELLPGHDAVERPQHRRRSPPAVSRASRPRRASTRAGSVDLKVNSDDAATFHVEIYRMRLLRRRRRAPLLDHPERPGHERSRAASRDDNTGLLDCSNWSVSATLTTTAAWPSGVYLLRLVREDTGTDNQILFIVRDDARPSQLLYGVADHDLPGLQQLRRQVALRLQLDRATRPSRAPPARSRSRSTGRTSSRAHGLRDWYTRNDSRDRLLARARGLRRRRTPPNTDLEQTGSRLRATRPTSRLRTTSTGRPACARAEDSARRRRQPLLHRLERGLLEDPLREQPGRPAPNRVGGLLQDRPQSGGPDPSGIPTGTWRDPAGANQPGERAHGRDVRRRQRHAVLPARRQRGAGRGPRLPLHRPRRTAAGTSHLDRPEPRRLGVGRARRATAQSRPA